MKVQGYRSQVFERRSGLYIRYEHLFSGIRPLTEPGLYLAVLHQAGTYLYDYPATYFTISDIGLHMRVYSRSTMVQAQHLGSAEVYEDVALTFYDKKGDILDQGRTDQNGTATFAQLKKSARLLVARRGDHTSILPLRGPALDLSAFELGEQPFRDLKLFAYGPRDLYRPGETMIIDALLRDYDGRPIDHTPPLEVTFKQPDGQKAKSFTWHGEALNAYHYAYGLPSGAQTGTWTVAFKLAGKMIQLYKFKVEDFMPERMKLTLDDGHTDITRIGSGDAISLTVQGDYLYGAPAAGNRVGCNVSMAPQRSLLEVLGPQTMADRLRNAGIRLQFPAGGRANLSMILGGVGTSLESLVLGYTALARGGMAGQLRYLRDDLSRERYLLSPGAAWIVRDMLRHPFPGQGMLHLVQNRPMPGKPVPVTASGMPGPWPSAMPPPWGSGSGVPTGHRPPVSMVPLRPLPCSPR